MTITLFAAVTSATGQQLDDNLTAVSNQAPIPCSVSGTNSITMTQLSNVYLVTAYSNNMQLSGVAAGTNTTGAAARLGSLGLLLIYKDTNAGPVTLAGGEIVAGNAFTLQYDSTLSSGVGGWHLFTGTQDVATQLNPSSIKFVNSSVLSRYISGAFSVSFSVFAANSAQDFPCALPGVLINDAVQVGPPSLVLSVLSFSGYVAASGSVNLRAVNAAAATVSISPGIFRVTAMG